MTNWALHNPAMTLELALCWVSGKADLLGAPIEKTTRPADRMPVGRDHAPAQNVLPRCSGGAAMLMRCVPHGHIAQCNRLRRRGRQGE